jgi:ribosomal-protein-alanine N-acetyltransferase
VNQALRRAVVTDIDLLAAIHAESFPPQDTWDAAFIGLQIGLPGTFAFLHTDGGMVLVRVAADEAEILTIGVIPLARGAGIGSDLLHASLAIAAEHGAQAMFLEVSVANDSARRVYDRLGFTTIGRRRNYYPDGSDALVLRRELGIPL